jgi:hypothetical protein
MKITKSRLKQIIKEVIQKTVAEQAGVGDPTGVLNVKKGGAGDMPKSGERFTDTDKEFQQIIARIHKIESALESGMGPEQVQQLTRRLYNIEKKLRME